MSSAFQGSGSPVMSFTVGTKDFRRALKSVAPHASRTPDLPMINRIRCYVDGENVTIAATDRFTAAMGLVSVWESSTAVEGAIDLALSDVGMIMAVFSAGAKENSEDAPEYQLQIELREKRTVTESSSPDLVTATVRITDVSGMIDGEVLEFPSLPPHSAFPDLPQLFANYLAKPAGLLDTFGIDGELLARLKVAAKAYGDKPLVCSTPGTERSPILARCGDSFLGLVMPVRLDEDAQVANKSWLDSWIRRLPLPSEEKITDLDEIRQSTNTDAALETLRAAAQIVITTQFGSPSMLQRRLSITYKAAIALLDQLARRHIVTHGEEGSSQAREVLVKPAALDATLATLTPEES